MRKLYLLALPLLLLASCNQPGEISLEPSSEEATSEATSETSQEEFISVNWDEEDYVNTNFNASSTFIDVNVGEPLVLGVSYGFSYGFSDGASVAGARVTISNNGVAELSNVGNGSFNLTGLKEGEIILKVYGADDFLHYRNLITFRRGMAADELLNFCYEEVDHYESCYPLGTVVTFIEPTKAVISGVEEGMTLYNPIVFDLEYNHSTETEHFYTVLNWKNENQGSTLNVVTIAIDKTGYMLHPLTRNGAVSFFVPVFA